MSLLTIYLIVYGVLALSHIVAQMLLAHLEYRRQRRRAPWGSYSPTVTVVVPAYEEDPAMLYRCLRSLNGQDYGAFEVIVVDDGSRNRDELTPIEEEFTAARFRVLLGAKNMGKRHCQAAVFDEARGEVIVTVDSDTVLQPDAISTIVRRLSDPRVGAVTGNVEVINDKENFLTRLISYRYWSAFNQERAAQSLFQVVMCASGPFSAYRRSIVDAVKRRYVSQTFLGEACTFGDDRHLTNLVLELDYGVVYDKDAIARTHVPNTLRRYLRQQLRWNKSFYREILWTARFAHRHHPYLTVDLWLQALLPFMLLGALAAMAYQAIFIDISHLWVYLVVLAAIGLLRAMYGMLRTRSLGFLSFTIYGVMHILLLIPTRIYALATIRRTHWGTRAEAIARTTKPALIAESRLGRNKFEEELDRYLDVRPSGGAVMALDLDGFRSVNEAHGHRAGERLLQATAKTLREWIGEAGSVTRIGGDEFAILIPGVARDHVEAIARDLQRTLGSRSLRLNGSQVDISASIGIAPLDEVGLSVSGILARAELAMFQAKQSGRGRVVLLEDREWREGGGGETRWSARIRSALDRDEFDLHAQPVRHVETGDVGQWELLLRLRQRGEVVSPNQFLPTAERFGLIADVDRWVLNKAVALVTEHAAGENPLTFEVNVSRTSVGDPFYLECLDRALEAHQLHPWDLVFEVTETVARTDQLATHRFADGVRALGCRFAIDDFGADPSDPTALLELLEPDYLKISGSLVRHLPYREADQRRVESLVKMGRRLGHLTVAQFVGDDATLDRLREYGVNYAQGYHIGRPIPATEIWTATLQFGGEQLVGATGARG